MYGTATERRADPRWEDAVLCLNSLGIGPKFAAAAPFQQQAASPQDRPPKYAPVHGPHDAAWVIGEWLIERLATRGIDELVAGAGREFDAAFEDTDLEIERSDQVLTFLVFYLTSPFGTKSRELTPLFSIAFEIWMDRFDRPALAYLHAVRDICVDFEQTDA